MPLNRDRALFTQEWINKLKTTPESAMVAEVSIWHPDDMTSVLVGKKYVTSVVYTLENVPARVQPLRASGQKFIAVNGTEVQVFTVQMPIEYRLDLRPGTMMKVTKSPYNPVLTKFTYVLKEVADSVNPIEWTLQFESDTELVDNG